MILSGFFVEIKNHKNGIIILYFSERNKRLNPLLSLG